MRVLITDNNLGDSKLETEILRAGLDAEVRVEQCSTEDEVVEAVSGFQPDAIIVQWAPLSEKVFGVANNLRFVSRMGIGVDMIDLDAAKRAGIEVRNVPHYCTEEVATHAVALALALNRRIVGFDTEVRAGLWDAAHHAPSIKKMGSSVFALIGLGKIGMIVASTMQALGAEVIAVDPIGGDDGIRRVTLSEVASNADFISLHAPLTPETHHILDEAFFAQCQRQPICVNTSRGPLIDTLAISSALKEGAVGGVGLDVFESEPPDPSHPLFSAPRTILTPHAAWCSVAALPELRKQTAANVVSHFAN